MTARPQSPKRQERGQRRIAEIVTAAADVFADVGYEAATTNAIAARAGISPGSLYQYFANKDEVARALAERYVTEMEEAQAAALDTETVRTAPLDRMVADATAPLIRFNLTHRGFKALFARADMPPALTEAVAPLHAALQRRVVGLIAIRFPTLPPETVERTAVVVIQIVRGMMPLIVAADGAERTALTMELRTVLCTYLAATGG